MAYHPGDNLRRFTQALDGQIADEAKAQGEYDHLIELLDEVADSPDASVFSPGQLNAIRADILQIRSQEKEHHRYLSKLRAYIGSG